MKKLSGFSLMEMMVVLLIISIIAAASAPMINKKMLGAAAEKSPWVWTGTRNNIAYNLNNAEQTASIGTINPPAAASDAKMYIDSTRNGDLFRPQIAFGHNGGSNVMKLSSVNRNIWFSTENLRNSAVNSVVLGAGATASANHAIAIGYNSSAAQHEAIAIGNNIHINNSNTHGAIAIGASPTISGLQAISIGRRTTTNGNNSIVIGSNTASVGENALSIGRGAISASQNTISIGANSSTYMPRSIAVGQNAYVGVGNSVQARAIAIGYNAVANKSDAIAIGGKYGANATRATGTGAIAIGSTVEASGYQSIAIGGTTSNTINVDYGSAPTTRATGSSSVALGMQAYAGYSNSVAIGRNAATTASNQIVLGTKYDTVVIPGKIELKSLTITGDLVVEGNTLLGGNKGANTYVRENQGDYHRIARFKDTYGNVDLTGSGKIRGFDMSEKETVTINGKTYYSYSDRRLKNVGKAFTSGLDKIRKLEVFNYTFKDDKSKTPRVGVIAQDLQKIFPDAVIKGDDGFLRIRMEDMFYAIVNAVKENDRRITALEKENKALKERITELEKKLK